MAFNSKITAWDYARQLAAWKGVRTITADHDAFENDSLRALTQGKDLRALTDSSDDEDRALTDRVHTQRELRARNILKDWALDNLPPEGSSTQGGRKPKLVLLFGGLHREGLEQAFSDIGIDAEVSVMESTDVQGRAREQAVRVMRDAMKVLIPHFLESLDPPATREQRGSMDKLSKHHASSIDKRLKDRNFRGRARRFGGGAVEPPHDR